MADIRIRAAGYHDRFALARITIDATFSAFHGRVPDACLNWLDVEESAENWGRTLRDGMREEYLQVAEVEGLDIAGLILAGRSTGEVVQDAGISSRYGREITSLQVAPAWQRKGIGRMLVCEAARLLAGHGGDNLLVRVLEDNPNTGFYRQLGAREVGSQPFTWEGYETAELVLVWDDIECLT